MILAIIITAIFFVIFKIFIYHFNQEKEINQRYVEMRRQFDEEYQYWDDLTTLLIARINAKNEEKVDWKNEGF